MSELVPSFISELYTPGAPTAELHDDLDVAPEDLVVDKPPTAASRGLAWLSNCVRVGSTP